MHNIIAQRNIFINTETLNFGDGQQCRISVPPAPFTLKANQRMKLSLQSLQVRRNWYDINQSNNTFFFSLHLPGSGGDVIYPCIIPPGTYYSFGTINISTIVSSASKNPPTNKPIFPAYSSVASQQYATYSLCDALAFAVLTTLTTVTNGGYIYDWLGRQVNNVNYTAYNAFAAGSASVSYSYNSRKIMITLPAFNGTYSGDFNFVQMKSDATVNAYNLYFSNNNPAIYGNWLFQDSHEILGGTPTRENTYTANVLALVAGLTKDSTGIIFTSTFVAALSSLDNLYVRLISSNTSNYASPNLDRDAANLTSLTPTTILASIPVNGGSGVGSVYSSLNDTITFQDTGGGIYMSYIDSRYLESLTIAITDDKNRPIIEVAANESKLGILSYKLSLKWEVEQLEFSASSAPSSIDIQNTLSPVGFVSPLLGMNNFGSTNVKYDKINKSSFTPVNGNRVGS